MKPNKWKNKRFRFALKNSLKGIRRAFRVEKNLRIQIIFAILAMMAGIFFEITPMEWMILIITIGMVLCAELMNTAIEKSLDLYTQEYNKKIKVAKDIASGAVLITAIVSAMIGCVLFLPKILG